MSIDYRTVLADLERQRGELDAAILAISRLAGIETVATADETIPAHRATTRAPRATKQAKGETARPTDALAEQAIRTALKQGHHKVDALITATELPAGKVRRLLAQMHTNGVIRVEGQSRATRYHLA